MKRRSLAVNSIKRLLCLTFIAFANFAYADIDPAAHWDVLETSHFQVIYDSRHQSLAERYASAAEHAYSATEAFFKDRPRKTVLVIADVTDLANGFATGLPYPLITAFPVLPSPLESIDDYGNWESELVTHEYVHIMQFEPAGGVVKPLRLIFGTIARPNMLLPRWYLEGQAVFMESRLSNAGRLRSNSAMAIPRALAEEGSLSKEDISRIGETNIPDGLGGQRPYLLGGVLWSEIATIGGEDVLGKLNEDYGRRMPFFINGPPERRLGADYAQLLAKAYERVTTRATEQIAKIEAAGKFQSAPFDKQDGMQYHSPAVAPDGKSMVFISQAHNTDERIEYVERGDGGTFRTGKRKVLAGGVGINRASWLPDSSGVVFDKIDAVDRYYQYSDIFHYDIASKKTKRLSRMIRAREPVVSKDGKTIYFVQLTNGGTRLARMPIAGNDYAVIYSPAAPNVRLSRPEVLNDNEIVFAEKQDGGGDLLRVLDLQTNSVHTVLEKFKPVAAPKMTDQGLVFTSGVTGIDNIYLADAKLTDARPISNVTTRAMTAEIDPTTGELFFARLHAYGPRLHSAEKTAWQEAKLAPPQIENTVGYKFPDKVEVEGPPAQAEQYSYSAWRYMVPRYWVPFVYFVPGGTYVSASTSTSDPLNRHSYSAQVSYDTLSEGPSFSGSYTNDQIKNLSLSLSGGRFTQYVYSADLSREITSVNLSGAFPLTRSSTKWQGILGVSYTQFELKPDLDTSMGGFAGVGYTDVSQRGLQISPEKGGSATLTHTSYVPRAGSLSYDITDFNSAVYFSKWLPKRHALATFVNASYAPRLRNVFYGRTTSAAFYSDPLLSNEFVMRGYPSGAFLGRTLLNANVEYRFPIAYPYKGSGTKPWFLQRTHAALFTDLIAVDGFAYDPDIELYRRTRTNHTYVGYGGEVRFDLTTFYYLPLRVTIGLYYGADKRAGLGFSPFVGLSL